MTAKMTFDLKEYQRRVLARLEEFLRHAAVYGAADAYDKVAKREDENGNPENPHASRVYRQTIEGLGDCPHVCLRIPTGGGKTYLAARAVEHAARFMEKDRHPTVLWLAPSDTIRAQTAQVLKDRNHPCRIALEQHFGFDIVVRDIGDFDASRPLDFDSSACIIVSTAQMFRVRKTAKPGDDGMTQATRRIYASHEHLQPHFERFLPSPPPDGLERDEKGEVKHSFVNLLHLRRPLVILDEAHNFLSDLSQEVLRRINPKCILEWTATPREKPGGESLHNVLVSVPAEELQAEEMLKIPVWLTEHKGWEQAVNGAVAEREQLAKAAKESGDAVRPIVLYQAQSDTGKNPITPAKLRRHLIDSENIDDSAIAIATGEIKDLRDIDVFAADCPIEHIITVQALREGWDCSYAYILCSVANMQAPTAVEQLMGRVMRMPEAKRRKHDKLNLSYAHLPSDIATDAVGIMRDKMAKVLGFEEEEVRRIVQAPFSDEYDGGDDGGLLDEANRTFSLLSAPDFGNLSAEAQQSAKAGLEMHPNAETGGCRVIVKKPLAAEAQSAIVRAMPEEQKTRGKRRLEYINRRLSKPPSPSARGVKFAALPQLFFYSPEEDKTVLADGDSLHTAAEWNDIRDDCLIENFAITETATTFEVTLMGGNVVYSKQGSFDLPPDAGAGGEKRLVGWLERQIRHADGRYFPEPLRDFINANINALDYSMRQLARAKYQFAEALKQRLAKHEEEVGQKTAKKYLFGKKEVECRFSFAFPKEGYAPGGKTYRGGYQFRRHYYDAIGDFDSDAEYKCAVALDMNDDVRHWVRNVAKADYSYRIPLEPNRNFYPDFVAELTSGEVLVVEYKGALYAEKDRHKKEAGEFLESKAGGKCFFAFITEGAGIPGTDEQIKSKIRQIRESNKQ